MMENAEQSILQKVLTGEARLDEAANFEDRKVYGIAITNQNAEFDNQILSSNRYRVNI